MKKASPFHVNESDLLCKNRCGFYGNTLWKGYCSVCYKKVVGKNASIEVSPIDAANSVVPVQRYPGPQDVKQVTNFARFEEKRRQYTERKAGPVGIKSLFAKRSPKSSRKSTHSPADVHKQPTTVLSRNSSSGSSNAFSTFLHHISPAAYSDISKKVQAFVTRFKSIPQNSSIEVLSDSVQEFFSHINNHISSDPLYHDCDETTFSTLMDYLESFIMNKLYNAVFCPPFCSDEQEDLKLHKRIHSLHWVTIELLEANVNNDDIGVRAALDKAISDIIQLDAKRPPKEKLSCIVECSKSIFQALKLTADSKTNTPSVASADDFLPVFIFIILKANPPRLKSNINYITRFAWPARLNSGEEGYFFTNMCCVVDFVEKLNAYSLNISEDQFKMYMSGEALPDGTNTIYMCEGLRLLHENQQMITKLKERQQQCMSSAADLDSRITDFRIKFDEEIDDVVTKTCLTLKTRSKKADLDAELDLDPRLPLPLLPQPVHALAADQY